MTPVTHHRRAPLGLSPDRPVPRHYDGVVEEGVAAAPQTGWPAGPMSARLKQSITRAEPRQLIKHVLEFHLRRFIKRVLGCMDSAYR
jgi:hypothetical protein